MLTGIRVLAARLLAAVCPAMVGNAGCGRAARAGRRVRALARVCWHRRRGNAARAAPKPGTGTAAGVAPGQGMLLEGAHCPAAS